MDGNNVVPSAHVKWTRDAKNYKAIGLDMWGTVARIVRESDFWTEADVAGVVEPLLLVKSELGLTNPAVLLDQEQINAILIHYWCTAYGKGDIKAFLEKLSEWLKIFGIECTVTPGAVDRLEEITGQERKDFHLYSDVPAALKALKAQGNTLVLMPNQSQFNSDKFFKTKGFGQYIDRAFWSYELGLEKPDPRYFRTVLKELGIKPEEFLFVDDQPANLLAARSLGINVVRIERESRIFSKKLSATVKDIPVIRTLTELV